MLRKHVSRHASLHNSHWVAKLIAEKFEITKKMWSQKTIFRSICGPAGKCAVRLAVWIVTHENS